MKIPPSFYGNLRAQIRTSEVVRRSVNLTRKGGEYTGLCPFHMEKSPSFTVNDAKGFFHCFGCGAHGTAIDFVARTVGLSYKEAAIKLAEEYRIELPKVSKEQERLWEETDRVHHVLSVVADFFIKSMTPQVKEYLKNKRHLSDETIAKYGLGYAPKGGGVIEFCERRSITKEELIKSGVIGKKEGNRIYEVFFDRIIFPIKNVYSKIIGFGGRAIGDAMPKYLNSPETITFKKSESLYGEEVAINQIYKSSSAILVEGYFDVLALHQAGFTQAVASLGTAVGDKHLSRLWQAGSDIIVCLDGDAAGEKASRRVIDVCLPLISSDKQISFIKLPAGKDPDDFISSFGADSFKSLIKNRISLSEKIWLNEFEGKVFASAEERAALEAQLNNYCDQIKDGVLGSNFRRYFKDLIWQNVTSSKRSFSHKQSVAKVSPELHNVDSYSEEETIEYGLLVFLMYYPEVVRGSEEYEDFMLRLEFSQPKLSKFRDWLFYVISDVAAARLGELEELSKSSGFFDIFSLLCNHDKMFIDLSFAKKYADKRPLMFRWLQKKYYTILLAKEYRSCLSSGLQESQDKSSYYLKEIQAALQEIESINRSLINVE